MAKKGLHRFSGVTREMRPALRAMAQKTKSLGHAPQKSVITRKNQKTCLEKPNVAQYNIFLTPNSFNLPVLSPTRIYAKT